MKAKYPSWEKGYQKAYRSLKSLSITPQELAIKRAKAKEYYQTVGKILVRRRYANDPVYRERMKRHAREFYKTPDGAEKLRKSKRRYYLNNRAVLISRTKEWINKNRDKWLLRNAERRRKNRTQNRKHAALQSLNLTDSYVRNQLSKYTDKSTHEWTAAEVNFKRSQIIHNRSKMVSKETVNAMRDFCAQYGWVGLDVITKKFNVTKTNACGILGNKFHHDPNYNPPRKIEKASNNYFLKVINAAATLSEISK